VTALRNIRNLALALGIGALVALVIDAALQNALDAVRSPGVESMTPWWVIGRVTERSLWVAFALLAWLLAAALARMASIWSGDHSVSRDAAFEAVGRSMIAVPLVWLLATWLVIALRITLVGEWGNEGTFFLTSGYYYNVALGYAPWAAGGIVVLMLRRHVTAE
jgi:hypothetical protein